MSEVSLPRWVLFSLVGGLAVSSLTAVFLAGRLTAPAPPAAAHLAPAPAAAQSTAESTPSVRPVVSSSEPRAVPAAATPEAASQTTAALSEPGDCNNPADVRRYLGEMEAAVSSGKTWDDPTQLAQTIVADALAGRTEGLDGLIASSEAVLRRVDDTRVPSRCPDCTTHKEETRDTLRASLSLLEAMSAGIATGDLTVLMGAQAEAARLEARARTVERLDDDLRKRCSD